jgi:hypothetical protein
MARTEGWVVGYLTGTSNWVTVPGSAYRSLRDILHPTREDAEAERDRYVADGGIGPFAVRYVRAVYHPGVTVTNTAFRVIDPEPAEVAAFFDAPPVTDPPRRPRPEITDPADEDAARLRGAR